MSCKDPDELVDRLISGRSLAPLRGSTTALKQGRTPFSVGVMVHGLVHMPLLAGCTKVTLRIAQPCGSGFRFLDDVVPDGSVDGDDLHSSASQDLEESSETEEGGVEGGGSQVQDSESRCLQPSFADLWTVRHDVPASAVAVISVSCIERARKVGVGTMGYVVVNLFNKRGTYTARVRHGSDPALFMNVDFHKQSRSLQSIGVEQLTSPVIPLLGLRYTCYWGGGHAVPVGGHWTEEQELDQEVLAEFPRYHLLPGIKQVDEMQLTASELAILEDRHGLVRIGFVGDARPSALNLAGDAAEQIFEAARHTTRERWRSLMAAPSATSASSDQSAAILSGVVSAVDRLGVTPFNVLRGIAITMHQLLRPEPFPTPSAARTGEVTVPFAALNQLCIFKIVVEVGGLLPGVSHVDWNTSTPAEPVFNAARSTIVVRNIPIRPEEKSAPTAPVSGPEGEGLERNRSVVRFVTPPPSRDEERDGVAAPDTSTGPLQEYSRTKGDIALAGVFRVYAILPKYEALPPVVAGAVDSAGGRRAASSVIERLGYLPFDPGQARHWHVVPHSWGALLLIPKGQPFTAAQFRREVPLFRGQPADKHLADLAACRDESYDALFASWLKSKSVERSSSGMTLVASSADGSRELEMRAMRQGSPSHQGPRGILRSGHPAAREAESSVLLRDALLLHQRVRTEKELETITNAVFASAVFGDE